MAAGEPERTDRRALAIVPARLGSTRLARKMLLRATGRYLFEHTAQNALRAPEIERVVVATDSDEIQAAAAEVGIEAIATSPAHPSGTDRAWEALSLLRARGEGPWPVVVDVQGDEPELPPEDLGRLVRAFADPAIEIATLADATLDADAARDPSIVKVVADRAGDALYFSRAPIPYGRGTTAFRRHVGVYAFRPAALERFCALPRGVLEAAERLEQLRWLEAGGRMRVLAARRSHPGIDTAEHYEAFRARVERGCSLEQPRTR
jgi:3-deoxy-manno-octulosonate cytidylyltransferase (CMP-KDO synthetase)